MARLTKEFKEIPGYPGIYINNRGDKIYSIFSNRYLTISINNKGRKKVHIRKSLKLVSRLVAITFLPNPENKPCVCHKDNNPLNNQVSNLYWGTYKENTQQMIFDNRHRPRGKVPLTIEQVNDICHDYSFGLSRSKILNKYGIGNTRLSKILSNNNILRNQGNNRHLLKVPDIINDYKRGMKIKDICNKYQVGRSSIFNYLRKEGIIRNRHENK